MLEPAPLPVECARALKTIRLMYSRSRRGGRLGSLAASPERSGVEGRRVGEGAKATWNVSFHFISQRWPVCPNQTRTRASGPATGA